jgi:hypothetical protein
LSTLSGILLVVFDHYLDDRHVQVWVAPGRLFPAGLRPLSQVSALKRSPRALGVPYRGRMGKRDALARLAFSARRRRAAGNACGGGVLATDREPVASSHLGYVVVGTDNTGGTSHPDDRRYGPRPASTVGLFSG